MITDQKRLLRLLCEHNPRVVDASDTVRLRAEGPDHESELGALVLRVENLTGDAAALLGQEIARVGGKVGAVRASGRQECVRHEMLLSGSRRVWDEFLDALTRRGQAEARDLSEVMAYALDGYARREFTIPLKGRALDMGRRTLVMGILNVTPDSFSDGGEFADRDTAIAHGERMLDHGADIIDVGGESTRPNADPVSPAEQIRRVVPVIRALAQSRGPIISIDTTSAEVAAAALDAGAEIVNDVSALRFDPALGGLVAERDAPLILMHMLGRPRTMQENPRYNHVIADIARFLRERVAFAVQAGVSLGKIIVDPGIGFGKTVEHNLEIMRRLDEFRSLGRPLMIGASRKSVIGKVLGVPVDQRVFGTAATLALCVDRGAVILRVHDVNEAVQVARMADAIAIPPGRRPAYDA